MNNSSLSLQQIIENLLRATGRENVENLLTIIREHGYYRVGCHRHHMHQGGLAQHALEVLWQMKRHESAQMPMDSIVVVALLHDLCNIRGFAHIRRHGSRSVRIATREAGFKLKPTEYSAILWHMHGMKEKGTLGASFDKVLDNPLWQQLRKADHYSSANPMTKQQLIDTLEGKTDKVAKPTNESHSAPKMHAEPTERVKIPNDTEKRFDDDTEKRLRALKRSLPIEHIRAVVEALGYNSESLNDSFSTSQSYKTDEWKEHNEMFDRDYLKHAAFEEIEDHREELFDRRSAKRGAAKLLASYIYEETNGVFKTNWKVNAMYDWLVREFGFKDSYWTFYKACQQLDGYNRRK